MQVTPDVLAVISRAEVSGSNVVLTEQLDRKMYVAVNKVLEAAGGKWNKKAKAHVFDGDAAERIDQIVTTGEVDVPKDEFNFFPTPPAVVKRLMELACIEDHMVVLEPSAGRGALAHAAVLSADAVEVHCYELMEANVEAIYEADLVDWVCHADFLAIPPEPVYDRVVMNPPFMKQADIKHVMHAHKFLKPDGILVSVTASSVLFRDNKLTTDFRAFVEDRGGYIEPLPEGSFKESGTMVNTVVVVIPA